MTRDCSSDTVEKKLSLQEWIVMLILPLITTISTYNAMAHGERVSKSASTRRRGLKPEYKGERGVFLRRSKAQAVPQPLSILRNAFGVLRIPSFVLLVASQCVNMFYGGPLAFWKAPLQLYAIEAYPEVFLGLSYTVVSSLKATIGFIGGFSAAFVVPYLTQKLESGTGICDCLPPLSLGLPIMFTSLSVIQTLHYVIQIISLTSNFPIFTSTFFVEDFADTGESLNILRIILATTPASQRSSALSMRKMLGSITNIPSAQVFAAISDSIRGDSNESIDRLEAIQKTFLYTWAIPLASTMMCFILLRFYRSDEEKAKLINQKDEDETSPLLRGKN